MAESEWQRVHKFWHASPLKSRPAPGRQFGRRQKMLKFNPTKICQILSDFVKFYRVLSDFVNTIYHSGSLKLNIQTNLPERRIYKGMASSHHLTIRGIPVAVPILKKLSNTKGGIPFHVIEKH